MRVAVETISRAREAIARIEHELRGRGLLLNGMKIAILTRDQYDADLKAGGAAIRAMKDELFETKVDLVSADHDELMAAMDRAKLDAQWGWGLFYHQTISLDDVIEELRPHLAPTDAELAEHILSKTLERAPGCANALSKEQFHFLVTRALIQLAAARSPAAIGLAASIVARFPDKTEIVCQYLQAVVGTNGLRVVEQIENLLGSNLFTTPWQQAWLYRVLTRGASHLSAETVARLRELSGSDGVHWLPRVESMKLRPLLGASTVKCWHVAGVCATAVQMRHARSGSRVADVRGVGAQIHCGCPSGSRGESGRVPPEDGACSQPILIATGQASETLTDCYGEVSVCIVGRSIRSVGSSCWSATLCGERISGI